MNAFFIFVVRLILGLLFGILLTRVFHPEWNIFQGALVGGLLVAIVYGIQFFKRTKS